MIRVEWTCPTDNIAGLRHGWTFANEEDQICRKHKDGTSECINWQQYAKWYAEEGPALRVWVNGVMVWFYEKGWFVDIDNYGDSLS